MNDNYQRHVKKGGFHDKRFLVKFKTQVDN